ncbi:MAG: efflux RND transporter periplasmic adaptor subunit [Lachnospiraceae bacterium]|nr:efflux RND transporter periplasmic adaptor subunit [Lachnospiraceae bacterium]
MYFDSKQLKKAKRVLAMALSAVMLLSGCGKNADAADEIVLIDPVSSANVTETVSRRTLYDYEVLDGGVFPVVTEYSAATGMKAADIGFFPGQSVYNGSVLFSGDMKDYYEQEKAVRSTLDELIVSYAESRRVNEIKLRELGYWIDSRDDDIEDNPYMQVVIQKALFEKELLEYTINDNDMIYNLDVAHYNQLLTRLENNQAKRLVRSYMNGTMVAVSNVSPGALVSEGTNVAAVTDGHSLNILADYRSTREMENVKEYYAIIDGKRYELTYMPYSAAELSALKASGMDIYSVFRFDDPEGTVKVGQKVNIVLIREKKEDLLSVSNAAIHRDDGGYYVSLNSGDKAYITKGFTDGVFTEIVSGVNEGDVILLDSYTEAPENVATLSRGDFYIKYEGTGYLYYPDISNITNNVKYGTVTLTLKNVVKGQRVKRGDVIAYVSVAENSVKLEELTLKLTRLYERRDKAQEAVDDPLTEFLDKDVQEKLKNAVSSLDRQIQNVSDQILEIQEAYAVTAFYAPCDGVIGYITELSDGAVLKDNELIATVAADSSEYLYAMNESKILMYGMELTGEYKDPVSGEIIQFPATVSSVSFGAVSSDLASDRVYVKPEGVTLPGGVHDPNAEIAAEIPSGVATVATNPYEEWLLQQEAANAPAKQSYTLTGYLEYETDVVLVPARAVTFSGDQAYVTVFDGEKYVKIGFIAGGANPTKSVTIDNVAYIWAAEGLEEGMVIVY